MSRKSNKGDAIGNPSTIANAMYDAQKKEITSSIVLSLSFIAAGLIVVAIGIFQFLKIKKNMIDSSENIDAMAWVVIAGVGLLVGIIGLISILKSFVSLGQIGSWAKEAESHASPFHAQKLHRKVAAMNQAQAMKTAAEQGMAEGEKGQRSRIGFFKRGKENRNKKNSDELYYKYNPQEKKQMTAPHKSAPMMEQKFDYGLNEEKKLTFADEFLKKNKRDPFAQYRKDLGLQEEVKQEVKQKPKFIISNSAPNNAGAASAPIEQSHIKTGMEQSVAQSNQSFEGNNNDASFKVNEEQEESMDFAFSYLSQNLENTQKQTINDSVADINYANETADKQKSAENVYESFTTNASSPYGEHNESDNDIFFSSKASAKVFHQGQTVTQIQQQENKPNQQPRKQTAVPNLAVAMAMAEPKSKTPPSPTVMLDLDYKKKRQPEEYDFSLFEEIDPGKSNLLNDKHDDQIQQSKNHDTHDSSLDSTNDYNNMFYGNDSSKLNQENDNDENDFLLDLINSNKSKEPSSSKKLNYSLNTGTVSKKSQTPDFHANVQQPRNKDSMSPVQSASEVAFNRSGDKPVNNITTDSKSTVNHTETFQNNPISKVQRQTSAPTAQTFGQNKETQKSKASKTTTPPKTRMTRRNKQQGNKKSFSEMFLSKNGNNANHNSSEIVKNGTRSQRKFIDASEYDEWSCPQCGKINQEYVGVCACGTRKPRPRKN